MPDAAQRQARAASLEVIVRALAVVWSVPAGGARDAHGLWGHACPLAAAGSPCAPPASSDPPSPPHPGGAAWPGGRLPPMSRPGPQLPARLPPRPPPPRRAPSPYLHVLQLGWVEAHECKVMHRVNVAAARQAGGRGEGQLRASGCLSPATAAGAWAAGCVVLKDSSALCARHASASCEWVHADGGWVGGAARQLLQHSRWHDRRLLPVEEDGLAADRARPAFVGVCERRGRRLLLGGGGAPSRAAGSWYARIPEGTAAAAR